MTTMKPSPVLQQTTNSTALRWRCDQSTAENLEPTCMAIHGWSHCRARTAVGAATAPSVLAPSCDASRTDGAAVAATLAWPRRQDVQHVRLVILFRLTPRWPSKSGHGPKTWRSTTKTPASLKFGTQQPYLGCHVNVPPGEPSTPWKYCGRLIRGCSFEWCHWFSL